MPNNPRAALEAANHVPQNYPPCHDVPPRPNSSLSTLGNSSIMTSEQPEAKLRFVSFDPSKPAGGQLQCQTCCAHFSTSKELRNHVAAFQVRTANKHERRRLPQTSHGTHLLITRSWKCNNYWLGSSRYKLTCLQQPKMAKATTTTMRTTTKITKLTTMTVLPAIVLRRQRV